MMRDEYGFYVARPGAEFWYEHFWKPRLLSAWFYELVRRLPKIQAAALQLRAADLTSLHSMPPYPQLSLLQRKWLSFIVSSQLQEQRPDDLLGSTASWLTGQSFRLGDWEQIEHLDLPAVKQKAQLVRWSKNYAARYSQLILGAWNTMPICEELGWLEELPRHKLSDCSFDFPRIEALLKPHLPTRGRA